MLINLIYLNPAPPSFIEDMQIAAAMLDAAIFNPFTVNITVTYGVGVPDQNQSLGGFIVPIPMPYPALYTALWLHDTASVSALPLATTLDGREFFTISTAQAKAFALLDPTDPIIDGAVE